MVETQTGPTSWQAVLMDGMFTGLNIDGKSVNSSFPCIFKTEHSVRRAAIVFILSLCTRLSYQ